MCYLAQPPEAVAGLVPNVSPGRKGGKAEVLEPKSRRDEAVTRGEEDFAPRPR